MSRCDLATWCLCDYCEDRRYSEILGDIQRWESRYQLKTNSAIPHEQDCDAWNCKKEACFQFEPDKIVGERYDWDAYQYIGRWPGYWKNLNYQFKNLDIE